jgi:hypothetical protein
MSTDDGTRRPPGGAPPSGAPPSPAPYAPPARPGAPAGAAAPPGYGPPVGQGGYGPPVGQGGYGPPVGQGGYGPPVGQGGYGPPVGQGGYGPPVGQGGYGPPVGQGGYGPPVGQGGYGPPVGPPMAPLPAAIIHRQTHLISTVRPPSGTGLGAMAMLSMRRAFRLRIEPNEVLDDERHALAVARPPITDETQQAFLAWRRSVLFMAALLMIPVALLHAAEDLRALENLPAAWKNLTYLSVAIEAGFTMFLWTQVGRWTAWRRQARTLAWAWLAYFLMPFAVFLYPLAAAYDYGEVAEAARREMQIGVGVVIGAQALVSLAPKVISLLQGLIRAAIATKTLFPGASAPGWLIVIAAPLYMVVFYTFVLLPYHFTGSGYVVAGMLLVLTAKGSLVRAGLGLTKPMLGEAARAATSRALRVWMSLLLGGAALIVGGLWGLVSKASALTLINFALSMGANILLLTLIATDALITALDRARGTTPDEQRLAAEAASQVAAFTAVGQHDA